MFFARKLNMRGGKEGNKNQKREIKTKEGNKNYFTVHFYEGAHRAIKTCHHVKFFNMYQEYQEE